VEALIYRRDLLLSLPGGAAMEEKLQAGITWEQFLDFARRTDFPGPYYIFPAAEYEGLICSYTSILLGIDPRYFEKHGFDFDTKEAQRALQLQVDLVNRYGVTPKEATTMTEVPGYEYYARRNGLFVFGWTNFRKDMSESMGAPGRVRLVPPPHFSDGQQAATIGGWSLMVSRMSTKIDQSIDFIKFLLTPESQEVMLTRGGFSPVVKTFFDDTSYVSRYPELSEFRRLQERGVHRPSDEHYTRYSEILASYCSQAIRMKIGVQDALREATRQIGAERAVASSDRGGVH
jgi:ABC-type glycerol-3-phosphate transport system substrate-binding protein